MYDYTRQRYIGDTYNQDSEDKSDNLPREEDTSDASQERDENKYSVEQETDDRIQEFIECGHLH